MIVPLATSDRVLLQLLLRVVPRAERSEWLRGWKAELCYAAHPHRAGGARGPGSGLVCGLIGDALWLRMDSWNRALDGTAVLCLLTLASLCLAVGLLGLLGAGGAHAFAIQAGDQLRRFLLEAPLVLLVTFATISRRHVQRRATLRLAYQLRQQLFLTLKGVFVLGLAFLISTDLCGPGRAALPLAADIIQTFLAVILAICGLRWAFLDQQGRCKCCLVALTSPAQVGRPSRNLLEWNGTERCCRRGHGRLSSPELETSWCRHSLWLDTESQAAAK